MGPCVRRLAESVAPCSTTMGPCVCEAPGWPCGSLLQGICAGLWQGHAGRDPWGGDRDVREDPLAVQRG